MMRLSCSAETEVLLTAAAAANTDIATVESNLIFIFGASKEWIIALHALAAADDRHVSVL
jgi:hypothetical protein